VRSSPQKIGILSTILRELVSDVRKQDISPEHVLRKLKKMPAFTV
jgi:hypothetical protein